MRTSAARLLIERLFNQHGSSFGAMSIEAAECHKRKEKRIQRIDKENLNEPDETSRIVKSKEV